jgi:excisionase family DNA binding protein
MNKPLAYSIAEASEVSRIGRTSIYEAISSRELVARKYGRRTVILADDLRRWLQNLPITNRNSPAEADSHLQSVVAA